MASRRSARIDGAFIHRQPASERRPRQFSPRKGEKLTPAQNHAPTDAHGSTEERTDCHRLVLSPTQESGTHTDEYGIGRKLRMKTPALFLGLAMIMASTAHGKMVTKTVPYQVGTDKYERRPRVRRCGWPEARPRLGSKLARHQRGKPSAGAPCRLPRLCVFVADTFGVGKRPKNFTEAGKAAGELKANRAELRKRMMKAYETFLAQKVPLTGQIGATGFCFGGTSALELGRAGAKLGAIVTFHAGLSPPP